MLMIKSPAVKKASSFSQVSYVRSLPRPSPGAWGSFTLCLRVRTSSSHPPLMWPCSNASWDRYRPIGVAATWCSPFLALKYTVRPSPQVSDLGCQAFAILFDDIDHSLCQADSEAFSSFAHAQVFVTNEVYRFLGEPPVFLFCPTGEGLQESSCTVLSALHVNLL